MVMRHKQQLPHHMISRSQRKWTGTGKRHFTVFWRTIAYPCWRFWASFRGDQRTAIKSVVIVVEVVQAPCRYVCGLQVATHVLAVWSIPEKDNRLFESVLRCNKLPLIYPFVECQKSTQARFPTDAKRLRNAANQYTRWHLPVSNSPSHCISSFVQELLYHQRRSNRHHEPKVRRRRLLQRHRTVRA
jgi:hypothetical protein